MLYHVTSHAASRDGSGGVSRGQERSGTSSVGEFRVSLAQCRSVVQSFGQPVGWSIDNPPFDGHVMTRESLGRDSPDGPLRKTDHI